MFAWNAEQETRQLNYERYRKLTVLGYSISSEYSAQEALYVVNVDPFGRSYYTKPVGEIVRTEELTGRPYNVKGWAVKEFIVDNKIQLVNKVSADLLVGSAPDISLKDAGDTENTWLADEVLKPNKFDTLLTEGAIKASSLGDLFLNISVEDDKIKITAVEPDYVDVVLKEDKTVDHFVYSWELSSSPLTGNKRIDKLLARKASKKKDVQSRRQVRLLRIKEFYKGRIEHSIRVVKMGEISEPVSMEYIEPELWDKAKSPSNKLFEFADLEIDPTESKGKTIPFFKIIEHTGVDEFMFIHWPNYRLMGWFGQSDNGMIESLQNALNSRETQLNDVLDKHSDPAMYGPPGFLDENGNLRMSEGGGTYFPVDPGDEKPGYLTWEGHIADVHNELKRIYKAICDNTEVAMSLTGMEEGGGAESGRALMYRLIRSLAMKARKATYLEYVIKEIGRTAQKLKLLLKVANPIPNKLELIAFPREAKIYEVEVTFKDNLPMDTGENMKVVGTMVADGLLSKETALKIVSKYFEEVEPDKELKKIKKEKVDALVSQWHVLGGSTEEIAEGSEKSAEITAGEEEKEEETEEE